MIRRLLTFAFVVAALALPAQAIANCCVPGAPCCGQPCCQR
jgi:hypothetical protein